MTENHSVDMRLKDVLMMVLVMHTEEDEMVLHTEKTSMLMLVVEIDVGGMTAVDQEASPAIVDPLRIELPFLEDQFQEDPPKAPPELFPPSKTTNLRNEITRFDESFYEAWERFNDLLRACPHHGFFELHQLDTFYNALNSKSKVRQTRAKAVVSKVSTSSSTPAISSDVVELKDMVRSLLLDKKNQSLALVSSSTPTQVKAVEPNCVTCGADFVVVDFEPDPRVSLILRRCFLKTGRALIDVHKGELTLRIENEAITYNLDQTSNDFLLFEEADAFLGLVDDLNSPEFDPPYYDPEGDILLLKAILNSESFPPLPNHDQYLPSFKKELKVCEAKTIKSFVDEPLEVELKDLPPHLEYTFLEGDNKLPIIIAKELGDEEKSTLIKVLKSHKRAIAWKLSDIQGINLNFVPTKFLWKRTTNQRFNIKDELILRSTTSLRKRLKNFLMLD
nr:hypothetical protein [Tanacetum cinerariifolium]